MTGIRLLFLCGLAALPLAGCDGGRAYPPGFTDDGIRFSEDDWRFHEAGDDVSLWYEDPLGTSATDPMISCRKPDGFGLLDTLEIRTSGFEALQQWPQPPLAIAIGDAVVADRPTLAPKTGNPEMKVTFKGRDRDRLVQAIERGEPMVLRFADQTRDIRGVPQSMREGFARKCRGED